MWCIHIVELTWPLFGKNCFILEDKFDFHMIDNLLILVHTFASRVLMSFSVDICNSLYGVSSASCLFFSVKPFISLDVLTFKVRSLGKLWIDMELMYPLAEHPDSHSNYIYPFK